ncbi:MAG: hypothetical protein PHS92_05260 [Candidatus Gracilibacteria bacterium]|nr:hypothetical protein [Candidatus Gracilibacteria bacterium]
MLSKAIAEPFHFDEELNSSVLEEIRSQSGSFAQRYEFIEEVKVKLKSIENEKKNILLKEINDLQKEMNLKNIRQYVLYRYFKDNTEKLNINSYRRGYQLVSRVDLQSDIHPYYLRKLENTIKKEKILNEKNNTFKSYVFLISKMRKPAEYEKSEDVLGKMDSLILESDFLSNSGSYGKYFDRLMLEEKANKYSINDFNRIRKKIIDTGISPRSHYFQAFLYWYSESKSIFKENKVILENNIPHDIQTKKLSCEANSATDFINYLYGTRSAGAINEQSVIDMIPTNSGALWGNSENELFWGDPSLHFVGDINGKQSRNSQKISGYGIYADPMVRIINAKISGLGIQAEKNSFSEENIIESLSKGSPVMFWYLLPVAIGNGAGYNFNPISWTTAEGNLINGYIGEHTGIIVGASIKEDGSINNLYYYEGREKNIQISNFAEIEKTAKMFDQMIHLKRS